MTDKRPGGVPIKLDILGPPDLPKKTADKFAWVRVGNQIQLDVGTFDLWELRELQVNPSSNPVGVKLYVSDRFRLSPLAAIDLYNIAVQMIDNLEEGELIPEGAVLFERKPRA